MFPNLGLFCRIFKCHDFKVIKEVWLPACGQYRYERLLRYSECKYCGTTRATITSPEPEEVRYILVDGDFMVEPSLKNAEV